MSQIVNRSEIRNRIMALSTPPATAQAAPQDNSWIYATIISMIVLVASVTGLVVSQGSNRQTLQATPIAKPLDPTASVVDGVSNRVTELERRFDTLSTRQWLLGLAHNENTVLTQQLSDQAKAGQKYMFFDENWRFDRMPEHLKLSDQEKRDLSAYIRQR